MATMWKSKPGGIHLVGLLLVDVCHLAWSALLTPAEVQFVNDCSQTGLSDFTAVTLGGTFNGTYLNGSQPAPLPPCVQQCPSGTVHAATSCVLPELSGGGIRLSVSFAYQCKSSDRCPWLSHHSTVSALQIRFAQWLKIPLRELKGSHITYHIKQGSTTPPPLNAIFIVRDGEPGYMYNRRLSGLYPDNDTSAMAYIAVRADTKRLVATDNAVAAILAYSAVEAAWFLNMNVSVFNASLALGLPPVGHNVDFQLVYGFIGQGWHATHIGKSQLPPVASPIPTTSTTTTSTSTTTIALGTYIRKNMRNSSGDGNDSGGPSMIFLVGGALAGGTFLGCVGCFAWNKHQRRVQLENAAEQSAHSQVREAAKDARRSARKNSNASEISLDELARKGSQIDAEQGFAGGAGQMPRKKTSVSEDSTQIPRKKTSATEFSQADSEKKVPNSGRSQTSSTPLVDPHLIGAKSNGNMSSDTKSSEFLRQSSSRDRASPKESSGEVDPASKRARSPPKDKDGVTRQYSNPSKDGSTRQRAATRDSSEERDGSKRQFYQGKSSPRDGPETRSSPREPDGQQASQDAPRRARSKDRNGAIDLNDINISIVDTLESTMRDMRKKGVPLSERKQFFQQQCLKWHPDKNPDDAGRAKEVFQHLQGRKAWFLDGTDANKK